MAPRTDPAGRQDDSPERTAEFNGHFRVVTDIAYREALRTTDEVTAGEVAQDVGIDFWHAWSGNPAAFSDEEDNGGWAVHAARMNVRDRLQADARRRAGYRRLQLNHNRPRKGWMDPEAAQDARDLEQVVLKAVSEMPERRRETFRCVREEGASYESVAAQRNVSVDVVKHHVKCALTTLRDAVRGHMGTAPRKNRSAPRGGVR